MSKALYEDHRLQDSARQIRLLKLDANNHNACDFGMIVCDLDHGPKFAAVSYTWGEPEPTFTILVDQRTTSITSNAKYALEQVAPRAIGCLLSYVWIDSICIDQTNLAEKNSQVALMGDIYTGASQVFACVGAHTPGSHDAFKRAHSKPFVFDPLVLQLSDRSYWSRVWIVQELFRATSTPRVLCGDSEVSLSAFLRKLWKSTDGFEYTHMGRIIRLCLSDRLEGIPFRKERRHHLGALIEQFSDSMCSNPRDHIFGLLSMVHWPKGLPGLAPDYSLTLHQLAYEVIPYLAQAQYSSNMSIDINHVGRLLKLFSIAHPHQLEDLRNDHNQEVVNASSREYYFLPFSRALLIADRRTSGSVWLFSALAGQDLTRLKHSEWKGILPSGHPNTASVQLVMFSQDDEQSTKGPLGTCVGFTSMLARPGDWLVSTHSGYEDWERKDLPTRCWLVVRKSQSGGRFDIMGNAWLDPYMETLVSDLSFFDIFFDRLDIMTFLVEQNQLDHCAWAGSVRPEFLNCAKPNSYAQIKRDADDIESGYSFNTQIERDVEYSDDTESTCSFNLL